jgi:hypothetical protein
MLWLAVPGNCPSLLDGATNCIVPLSKYARVARLATPATPADAVARCRLSLLDGVIHRIAPLPVYARVTPCRGSLGEWLALIPLATPPFC